MVGCQSYGPQAWWGQAESDFGRILQSLFDTIMWGAVIVFIVVEGVLFYAVFRYRQRRKGDVPPQYHGNTAVEIGWTIFPAVVLAFIAVPTVQTIFDTYPKDFTGTIQIKAIGHQWWWEFEYPELGIATANEIHFPAGQRITLLLESEDVIHAFAIPKLGGKRDNIPGHTNVLWWTADRPGVYYGQCTQMCGTSHANMRLRAVAHSSAEWDGWVKGMQGANGTPPPPEQGTPDEVARGFQLTQTAGCIGCHTIKGTPLSAKIGPDLTLFGQRTTLGAGLYPNTEAELIRWLKNPQEAKPGNKMPNLGLSDADAQAIAAYLRSLK